MAKAERKPMKKGWKIFLWILLVIFVLFTVFAIICCVGSDSDGKYVEGRFGAVGDGSKSFAFDEENGEYCFVKPDDRDFKILQLTDLHIGGGIFCEGKDKKVFDAVYKMINGAKPDLVVLTGDVLYPFPIQSGNIDNRKTAKQFAAFMEKLQVPWTLIFGNHDDEPFSFWSREKLADYFVSDELEYCVFTKNPKGENIYGYGNQIINVKNSDGSLHTSLVLFDSNKYVNGNMLKYDVVHDDQVDWYSRSVERLSSAANGVADGEKAQTLVFTHIPLNEFQTAWDLYKAGSDEVEYLWGVKDEDILAPATGKKYARGKLFDKIVELNSTKAVFCGHDHKNNFAIEYKGVRLSFSKSIVYLGLGGIGRTDDYRGGTEILLTSGGGWQSRSVGINEA